MEDNYKKALSIDKFSLDTEWQQQAQKYSDWSEKAVQAVYEKDKAKEQLELVEAELDLEIRKNPASKYGLDKFTEGAIKNLIIIHPSYRIAHEKYLEAIRNASLLSIAERSFDQRKTALAKLADLFISGYWAEPRVKREAKEVMQDNNTEGARAALQESFRRRRETSK